MTDPKEDGADTRLYVFEGGEKDRMLPRESATLKEAREPRAKVERVKEGVVEEVEEVGKTKVETRPDESTSGFCSHMRPEDLDMGIVGGIVTAGMGEGEWGGGEGEREGGGDSGRGGEEGICFIEAHVTNQRPERGNTLIHTNCMKRSRVQTLQESFLFRSPKEDE